MIGYRYLLPVIGFGPSTGIFILFLIKFLGGYGWKISLFYSAVSAVAFYYLFQVWLQIPMPLPLLEVLEIWTSSPTCSPASASRSRP